MLWNVVGTARLTWSGSFAVLLAAGLARADDPEAREQIAALPTHAEAEVAFVPRGWAVEQRMKADLDADKSPDEVLVLLQEERTDVDRERALIVLLGRAQGFALGGKNVGLLPPWGGAGMKGGDGAPQLKVRRGVLLVDQFGGSREFHASTSRFRWNRMRGCFELIGEDTSSADSVDGSARSTSCNLLTRLCEATVMGPRVDEDGNEIPARTSIERYRLPRQPLPTLDKPEFVSTPSTNTVSPR